MQIVLVDDRLVGNQINKRTFRQMPARHNQINRMIRHVVQAKHVTPAICRQAGYGKHRRVKREDMLLARRIKCGRRSPGKEHLPVAAKHTMPQTSGIRQLLFQQVPVTASRD